MDKKLKGDIAEQSVILAALKEGFEVLTPIGDRMRYDAVIDNNQTLIKIQVKSAYYTAKDDKFICNTRRTATNRREIRIWYYDEIDFDFACVYIPGVEDIYVIPIKVFLECSSNFSLCDSKGNPTKRMKSYQNQWSLVKEHTK